MELLWEKTRESDAFGHLSAVRFTESKIFLSDLENGRVLSYNLDGDLEDFELDQPLSFPYLLQAKSDSLVIFNAGNPSIDWYIKGEHSRTTSLPAFGEGKSLTYFPSVYRDKIFLKTQPEKGQSELYQLDQVSGEIEDSTMLAGPSWIHKGFLRSNDSELLSISSYYPNIYLAGTGLSQDSLRLQGFDTPMLARMRNKAIGEGDEAPLIISSAVLKDSLFFVTNLRPGWARVDVYDRKGLLQNILEEELPPAPTDYNTLDIDVMRDGDDYLIALIAVKQVHKTISIEYHAKLSLFRWNRRMLANSK